MQNTTRKVLVTGGNGQLAQCLKSIEPVDLDVVYLDKAALDITDELAIASCLEEISPDYVINCAAYTSVDGAELNHELANRINHLGVLYLAKACAKNRIKVIHISTDFVFDGKARKPYPTEASCAPINVYGNSKLSGELVLADTLPEDAMIIRTSWLYSEYGSNFVKTMLRLLETEEKLRVVHDQRGSPTYAMGLAKLIWYVLETRQFTPGLFHWCDKGDTTWYDFVIQIGESALKRKIISRKAPTMPILSTEYPGAAERPMYSSLYCYPTIKRYKKILHLPWQQQLNTMLDNLAKST